MDWLNDFWSEIVDFFTGIVDSIVNFFEDLFN